MPVEHDQENQKAPDKIQNNVQQGTKSSNGHSCFFYKEGYMMAMVPVTHGTCHRVCKLLQRQQEFFLGCLFLRPVKKTSTAWQIGT